MRIDTWIGYPPTKFDIQPIGSDAEPPGNTKIMFCQASAFPSPTYRWIKNGQFITEPESSGSLRLFTISRSDEGEYQCLANNTYGAILSLKATLKVAYLDPFTSTSQKTVTVNEGTAIRLRLPTLSANPKPLVSWFNVPSNTLVSTGARIYQTLNDGLVILDAKLSDNSRVFRATASSIYLRVSGTWQIDTGNYTINVQNGAVGDVLPTIIIPPSDTIAVQGDTAVYFECVINARPLSSLRISWFKKETARTIDLSVKPMKYFLEDENRKLTIKYPSTADAGIYGCKAAFRTSDGSNAFAPITRTANLTVHDGSTLQFVNSL
ncbi:protein sidekick-2-like [Tubulanus polymorphus]|uniref:protein sidekick-2-like n=1 Tax=Tubulanus polymorphus TaxID=672921 RepID=UPI003DA26F49